MAYIYSNECELKKKATVDALNPISKDQAYE